MENASGDWILVAGEQKGEAVLFSTVNPFLDFLNFLLQKKFKKEETFNSIYFSIFLYIANSERIRK